MRNLQVVVVMVCVCVFGWGWGVILNYTFADTTNARWNTHQCIWLSKCYGDENHGNISWFCVITQCCKLKWHGLSTEILILYFSEMFRKKNQICICRHLWYSLTHCDLLLVKSLSWLLMSCHGNSKAQAINIDFDLIYPGLSVFVHCFACN